MSMKDDYPAIAILADACADKADDSVPEAVRAWREIGRLRYVSEELMSQAESWTIELERLRRWKAEASVVLDGWEGVWMIAGQPGRLGASKAQAVAHEIERLREQNAAWMNGVADVVEGFGYDRQAACGPADLLSGLTDLRNHDMEMTRRLAECVEARSAMQRDRLAAQSLRQAVHAPDGNDRRQCTCGYPQADGVVHRTDGPCFHARIDHELPGLWERADFEGGADEVRP